MGGLIAAFTADTDATIACISAHAETGEVQPSLRQQVHDAAGAFGRVGAMALREPLGALEDRIARVLPVDAADASALRDVWTSTREALRRHAT